MTPGRGESTGGTGALARTARAVGPAARLRCPACGSRGLVRRWFDMSPRCPGCGLAPDRGEHDYFLGGMLLNLVVAELLVGGLVLGAVLATWPRPPWKLVTAGGVLAAGALPVAFYPFSKLLWLAVDLQLRPEEDEPGAVHGPDGRDA